MNARSAVVLSNVKKSFAVGGGMGLEALYIEHLTLPAGSCTVLKGRSGSGKTTLLNLIAGIVLPTAGTILVDGTDVFALSEARRDRFRAERVGYVFQNFNLLAAFSALESVMMAMMFAGTISKRLQRRRADELLTRLGLAARLAHKPHQLSRGEQQRVAIARALANGPPLILADEPCASLDLGTAVEVMATFLGVCRQEQKTLLLVSHEEVALAGADHVFDMGELNRAETRGR